MSLLRATAIIAVLTLGTAACDLFGPDVGPPSELRTSALPSNLVVGQSVNVSVSVKDAEERAVSGATVTWSPGAGSVAPGNSETDAEGSASTTWTLGTTVGTQTLVATVDGVENTFTGEVGPGPLAELVLSPADTTLAALGDTLAVAVEPLDQYGNDAAAPGLSWASSEPGVASVAGGIVVSHAEGTATITATSGMVSGTASLTVDQVVTDIGIDPSAPVMALGESLDADARAVDARGATVDTTLDVSWTSSNEAVATVSTTGVVDALAVGSATITATAGTFTGEAALVVKEGPRPSITDISPAVLSAGDTATITGSDFGATPSENVVTVAGAAAAVLTASTSQLTVELPGPGAFPCAPTGDATVTVSVDSLDTAVAHPVSGAPQHALAVGGSVALFGGDVACNELSEPGTYVVSVFNTTGTAASATAFQLQGSVATAGVAGARPAALVRLPAARPAAAPDPEAMAHLRMLEDNARLVERLGPPQRARLIDRPIAAQEVGDVRTFRIPDIEASNSCQDYVEVTARAVYSGTHGVIWEDTVAPLAGEMDATWEELGTEYDQVMHQILLDYFGDPLVYDDRLDGNGLFFMLFSETVNSFEDRPVNGFVFSGDFYTRSQCPASDGTEIFYGRVATEPGTGYDSGQIGDWAWRMRSTIIHEVKHITAYANKFDVSPTSPNFEETGLEEATARLAEEFYGRALQGYGQGDNTTYDESIYCEVRVGPSFTQCDEIPLIMGKHYGGVSQYLQSPALLSPFGPVGQEDASFYGSGWQWVRWVIDQSGQAEADLIKPLVREPSLIGPANLADKAGRSVAALLADYTLALAVDDHPSGMTPARAALTMPSWETRDIFQGLNQDFPQTYPTPWPLEPTEVTGDFLAEVPVIHGGAASIFRVTVSDPQLLELLSEAGGTAPSSLGLSVVRVQ